MIIYLSPHIHSPLLGEGHIDHAPYSPLIVTHWLTVPSLSSKKMSNSNLLNALDRFDNSPVLGSSISTGKFVVYSVAIANIKYVTHTLTSGMKTTGRRLPVTYLVLCHDSDVQESFTETERGLSRGMSSQVSICLLSNLGRISNHWYDVVVLAFSDKIQTMLTFSDIDTIGTMLDLCDEVRLVDSREVDDIEAATFYLDLTNRDGFSGIGINYKC